MDAYSKYDTFRTQYNQFQHKSFYAHHNTVIPTSRQLRKSIIPYASYIPPSTPIYLAPPIQPIPPMLTEPSRQPPAAIMMRNSQPTMFRQIPPVSMEMPSTNHYAPQKRKFSFTSKDIDAVLYGYLGDENNKKSSFHSLSGVRIHSSGQQIKHLF